MLPTMKLLPLLLAAASPFLLSTINVNAMPSENSTVYFANLFTMLQTNNLTTLLTGEFSSCLPEMNKKGRSWGTMLV